MSVRIDRVKLIAEMAKQGTTVAELADIAGVSISSISLIRSGKSCSESTAQKIAKGLNTQVEELITSVK